MSLNRREFLATAGAFLASPRVLFAQAASDRRFVFIIQRGAADGLHTVVPYADPGYAKLRGQLAVDPAEALTLDGTFALHPSLGELHRLYQGGQASFFHAVSSPYRGRSHFDGQNVIETGGRLPFELRDGWMNRLVGLLPESGKEAIAFAAAVPLALRGPAPVTSYAPSSAPKAGDDLLLRVQDLYSRDPQLQGLWSAALDARGMAGDAGATGDRQVPAALGRTAAQFLARSDGPRIAMIETSGWDTHSRQNARLSAQLKHLDALVAALRDGLDSTWTQTVVLIATEFGRTVAANGTGGTDHGTASVAILVGGAVQGGQVVTDWPGLAPGDLVEGRDLKPTLALPALIASACAETFELDPERTARTLFPGSTTAGLPERLMRG
jgi:uncharacterized protein (DUF1501 family)